MFNTELIGKRIIELRKNANMTQVELADKLNVSYQAVSNWERGNSMPDISKLPELADIFGCSIDDIINNQNKLVTHIINNDVKEAITTEEFTPSDVAEIIPILKPDQLVELIEEITEVNDDTNNQAKYTLKDIAELAVHLDDELMMALVDRIDSNSDLSELKHIVVPASDELISYIIDKFNNGKIKMSDVDSFIVHLSEENLNKIIKLLDTETLKIKDIQSCVVHLSEDNINDIIERINGKINYADISPIVVHLENSNMRNILNKVDVYSITPETLNNTIVHLDDDIIDIITDIIISTGRCSFNFFNNCMVHLPDDAKNKIVDEIIKHGDLKECTNCIVHLPDESRKKISEKLMITGDIDTLKKIAVHL